MKKIQIFCKNCDAKIGDDNLVAFYKHPSQTALHLIVKPERKNEVLDYFLITEQPEKKSKKFVPEIILCKKCGVKLGSNTLFDIQDRLVLCYKKEIIYFIVHFSNNQTKRCEFDIKTKWLNEKENFPIFELRNHDNFDGNALIKVTKRQNFIETVIPTYSDLSNFCIGSLVKDIPRSYQVELYINSLFKNTIICLPTGSGKTMVSAMLIAHMKQLNPKKKIFFVVDRIPLVFQQSLYLRYQCDLTTGEFCSENKNIFESQLDADIYVFTGGFLLNMLVMEKLNLEDCSCLVIDEIHHAKNDHHFARIIKEFYLKIDTKYKPRILGMTASPTSSARKPDEMIEEIRRLCSLIEGDIIMPVHFRNDFEKIIIKPPITFAKAEKHPDENIFIDKINDLIEPFYQQFHSDFNFKINIKNKSIHDFIINALRDQTLRKNLKKFGIACFLKAIMTVLEIMKVFGITKAVEILTETIQNELEKNRKNPIWSNKEIDKMNQFLNDVSPFNGTSKKLEVLVEFLNRFSDSHNSKIIIFVKSRKTAKLLCDRLNQDKKIKDFWQPKYCVGHASGNLDGMTWYEDQEPILDSFSEGKCKLVISTSVLQEGIDVAICDKVILFDTLTNLTQLVQSRGRARHKDAQLIAIDSQNAFKHYQLLAESERYLIEIVNSITIKNSKVPYELINKQICLLNQVVKAIPSQYAKGKNQLLRFSFQIFLLNGPFFELLNSVKQCKGFVQCEQAKDSYSGLNFFEKFECYNCLYEIKTSKQKLDENWHIFNAINFILKSKLYECALNVFKPLKTQQATSNLQAMSSRIDFGNLIKPNEFCQTSMIENSKFIIDFSMRLIKILFLKKEKLFKLEFKFDAIDELISIDCDQEEFNIYIPFRQSPFIFALNDENENKKINFNNLKNLDEEYIVWDRSHLSSIDLSLKINFPNSEKFHIIESFNSLAGINLLFSKVKPIDIVYSIEDAKRDFNFNKFSTLYALEAFISQNYYLLIGKLNQNLIKKLNTFTNFEVENILQTLSNRLRNKRFLNIDSLINDIIKKKDFLNNQFNLYENNLKISLFRRATITPTRIIYFFPEPNFSNRVTRKFGADNFLRIQFRDEDLKKLNMSLTYSNMEEIYLKIQNFLTQGLKLWDRNYEFLAMSSSQLRENGCWLFYKSTVNADQVREWMGDFRNIKCIGKYAARLGQSLSSSIETFHSNNYTVIDDIQVNDYCFTDGIGKISIKKAIEISENFFKKSTPASAYQIRFAGFKGVVAIDPNLNGYELQFRKSMQKFESGYCLLDVLNITDYIPCFLNRQIIIILSTLGIPDTVFDKLQDDMLKSLSCLLTDSLSASLSISKYYRCIFSEYKHIQKLNYAYESFFRDILKTVYQKKLTDLIKKSRIFVEKGRILMGTIDETGLLKSDQVFVQCSRQFWEKIDPTEVLVCENEKFIVNKKIIVAKNPCMHPGDIRVLTAVDIPQLRHMIDCIVFPSVGPRPITSMCSGSDLDGDLYFVSWEKSLIPTQVEEPLDYKSPKANEQKNEIQIEDVIKFFVGFIEMDQIGRIANAHVAISDQSPLGVKDPICIKLAKAFNLAVDFPKTGVLAPLPEEAKKLQYPDFMEKSGVFYISEKIIGKLYRKCKNIFINENFKDKILLNESLLVEGYENFLNEAEELYTKYRHEIERIMQYFNCTQESELFVGIYLMSTHDNEANDFFKLSVSMIKKLWTYMREKFFTAVKLHLKEDKEVMIKIASAWYYVCYTSMHNEKLRIISFPWILEDVFNSIDIKNFDPFSQSLLEKFTHIRHDFQLISRFIQKIDLKNELESITGHKYLMVGSIGLFLFEDKIDLQLVVYNPNKNRIFTEEIFSNLEKNYDNVSMNDQTITCDESEDINFTITDSVYLLKRFIYLRKSIFKNSELLPAFYSIVHFAKQDDLFLKMNNYKIKLDNYLEFFLDYLIKNDFICRIPDDEIESEFVSLEKNNLLFDCLDDWIILHDNLDGLESNYNIEKQGGKMILSFYQNMAFHREPFKFNNSNLDDNACEILRNHFYKVFNYVSKSLDVSKIWDSLSKINEPIFKQRFCFAKKKGKSPNLFVEDASLLLFSNNESNFDRVEFELYRGKRRSLHLNKVCYLSKINRPMTDFSTKCFQEFYHHSIKQFNKAKEMRSNYQFRIQLKFGQCYFTNVPSIFEDSSTILLHELKSALKKGYKNFNFSYNDSPQITLLSVFDENNNQMDDEESVCDPEEDDESNEFFEEFESQEKKKKKKKRRVINKANTAFDSHVNTDPNVLHELFLNNEFESKSSVCYVIYVELKNIENQKKCFYRLKYDDNMKLIRIETLPIKWLSIDIRNTRHNKENRDIRFNLISEKLIDLGKSENGTETSKLINDGILISESEDDLKVVEQFRNSPSIFARYSKSIKYYGDYENWKPLFDMSNVTIPNDISLDLLRKIRVSLSESKEFTDHDERGIFRTRDNRSEVSISAKIDINSLKASEINDYVILSWHIIQTFSNILS